ncbi:hypothetical protein TNCV_1103732 [Trichonephila clavipes]|nr:hypothetical protein TNCV_1103732 [Trichonephila clavipes]
MLDGDVTDAVEAQSLSLNPEHIDIYSASWGPDDDGKTVDGPGPLASTAFKEGILKGRNGLGSIFVWASGNGGREHDNCNCDGYTNSMWTLSISSATENGNVPWYSEACSSTLATTYSSGSNGERQIVTTDLHHGCTSSHTGTSASAPLAAGICALALEANKQLSWRDMQHIVVRTARKANLHAKDWGRNGVGRNVSHSFGYGLMDAGAMVRLAKRWNPAPVQKLCEIRSNQADKLIPAKSHVELSLYVRCEHVRFLEHVQAKLTLTASRRGDIHIYLTSPMGTRLVDKFISFQIVIHELKSFGMSSRHHIDDFMRGRIIGKIEEGRKITDVAREFDIAHSVVSRLWKSFKTTGMCSRRHGGGRVRNTTPAEDRYIVLSAKRNRRTTAQQGANQFLAASGKQISRKTVARRLRGGELYARRPFVCVPLTRQRRTAR